MDVKRPFLVIILFQRKFQGCYEASAATSYIPSYAILQQISLAKFRNYISYTPQTCKFSQIPNYRHLLCCSDIYYVYYLVFIIFKQAVRLRQAPPNIIIMQRIHL